MFDNIAAPVSFIHKPLAGKVIAKSAERNVMAHTACVDITAVIPHFYALPLSCLTAGAFAACIMFAMPAVFPAWSDIFII